MGRWSTEFYLFKIPSQKHIEAGVELSEFEIPGYLYVFENMSTNEILILFQSAIFCSDVIFMPPWMTAV